MFRNEYIKRADSEVRIETVLNDFFGGDVPYEAGKIKTHCPIGYDHSDGGTRKAMSVYSDTNSAWCFSHNTRFTPTTLWQLRTGLPPREAARDLLDIYGFRVSPLTLDERWDLLDSKEATPDLDRSALRGIVVSHAKSLTNYSRRQYDPPTVEIVSDILRTVDKLPSDIEYDKLEKLVQGFKDILDSYWVRTYGKESHD